MLIIKDFLNKYYTKIDSLDLDLLIAAAIGKPREFILTHPEYKIKKSQISNIKSQIFRRIKHEPLAYILGQKEFYGSEFKVNKNTLIPRPETEQLIELISKELQNRKQETTIIDIGTGSGNIIISIAKAIKNYQSSITNHQFYGIDISAKALSIAKQNSKLHKVSGKIKFLQGNLLKPILEDCSMFHIPCSIIIVANLPYLSSRIYNSAPKDVKNYEPKSALYSSRNGLDHYKKLFKQLKKLQTTNQKLQTFIEFSPEQKTRLKKTVLTVFPQSRPIFFKDLAGKFRVVEIEL